MDVLVSGKNVPRGEGKEELKPAFSARPSSSDVPQSLPMCVVENPSRHFLFAPITFVATIFFFFSFVGAIVVVTVFLVVVVTLAVSAIVVAASAQLASVASAATEQEEAWEEDALFDGLGHMEEKRRYTLPWGVSCIDPRPVEALRAEQIRGGADTDV